MAEKQLRAGIYVATKTFLLEHNVWVRQGDTVVAGHPVLKGRQKTHFVPFQPTFGEPEPEAAPEPDAPADAEAGSAASE